MLRPAASTTARKRSGKRSTSANVDTPTDPVDPRTATLRWRGVALMRSGSDVDGVFDGRGAHGAGAEEPECHQREVIPVHVVPQIEVLGEPGAGEMQLVPGT